MHYNDSDESSDLYNSVKEVETLLKNCHNHITGKSQALI